MCRMLRKSACPFGQVQTKMYLPKSPIFTDSLARASGLVLMSVPGFTTGISCSCSVFTSKFEEERNEFHGSCAVVLRLVIIGKIIHYFQGWINHNFSHPKQAF